MWVGDDIDTLVYIEPTPHFKQEKGGETIQNIEGEKLYISEEGVQITELFLAPNGEKIAFLCQNRLSEQWEIGVIEEDGTNLCIQKLENESKDIRWITDTKLIIDQNIYQITENGMVVTGE